MVTCIVIPILFTVLLLTVLSRSDLLVPVIKSSVLRNDVFCLIAKQYTYLRLC